MSEETSEETEQQHQFILDRTKTCYKCQKSFSGRSQLLRHLREVHKDFQHFSRVYDKDSRTFKCLEGCDLSFRTNSDLRHHLRADHNFEIKENRIKFLNISDFKKWLNLIEESGSSYIQKRGIQRNKNKDGHIINYYSCSRSGRRIVKTTDRKRKPKQGGSKKINAGCTSYIKLVETDRYCEVTYCDFHYGHMIELDHIPLKPESRAAVVDKLEKGAKLIRVHLNSDDLEFEGLIKRSDLLTRCDLKNLSRLFKDKNKAKFNLGSMIQQESSGIVGKSLASISNKSKEMEVSSDDSSHDLCEIKEETMQSQSSDSSQYGLEIPIDEHQLPEENDKPLLLEDRDDQNNQNIEIHYVEDEIFNTNDVEFGIYVGNMLQKINPDIRVLVQDEISQVLRKHMGKAEGKA